MEHNLHLVPLYYNPLTKVLGGFIFLCIRLWKNPIVKIEHSQIFKIFNMPSQELLSNISFQEERFKAYPENSYITKSQEILQTMLNYLFGTPEKLQLSKLQTKLKAVSHSTLYLAKYTWFNFRLDMIKVTTVVSSDIDTDTSHLHNQTWFSTLLSCNL